MDAGPSEGWAGWTAAGGPGRGCYKEEKAGECRWQRAGSGRQAAGVQGLRGRQASLTAGFRLDSLEIRGYASYTQFLSCYLLIC
jgi:hypothetical protein